MPDPHINVPPPDGDISMSVGQTLRIHAAQACTFCCSIGASFSPDLTSVQLLAGDSYFIADTANSGTYNTSEPNTNCSTADPTATAKSVQINP